VNGHNSFPKEIVEQRKVKQFSMFRQFSCVLLPYVLVVNRYSSETESATLTFLQEVGSISCYKRHDVPLLWAIVV